jgi:ferrochelatase
VPCLNDQSPYIEFLATRTQRWLAGESPTATQAIQTAKSLRH